MSLTGTAVSRRRPKAGAGGVANNLPDLAGSLPALRRMLDEDRRFRLDQLSELVAE